MNTSGRITIEIFRDAETPDVDLTSIEKGFGMVQQVVPKLEVQGLDKVRAIRLTRPDQEYIDSTLIRWPRFGADLNIVATERPMITREQDSRFGDVSDELKGVVREMEAHASPTLGYTHKRERTFGGLAVALVNVKKPVFPHMVSSHEIGHMLALKEIGETYDGDAHCVLENCLMYPYEDPLIAEVPLAQDRKKGWRRLSASKPKHEKALIPRAETFCAECGEQMGRYAYLLTLVKQGQTIPPNLMWGSEVT